VLENIMMPLRIKGVPLHEARATAEESLDMMGLGPRKRHKPGELSGGEQQRVAIARALINNPALLLADEPCANLDTKNSTVILELLKKLNHDLNQTVVMVSHEEWHQRYFDRVVTLQDGKILSDGRPDVEGA
jgi:putative ABC transport system ATP-binding protein